MQKVWFYIQKQILLILLRKSHCVKHAIDIAVVK